MRGTPTKKRFWSIATGALLLGLVLRSAIPLGYMPGNLLAGEFMVLCPTGVPASMLETLSGHHGHHDASTLDADRDCPIGSALKPAWIVADWFHSDAAEKAASQEPGFDPQPIVVATLVAYRQRAPPQV